MSELVAACEQLMTNLATLSEWPDDLSLENMRRTRLKNREVNVMCWRENVGQVEETFGGDDGLSAGEYEMQATLVLAIEVAAKEKDGSNLIDGMLIQAGDEIERDRTLGGHAQDIIVTGTDYDFEDGGESGLPFQSVNIGLTITYFSTNPIL